jgi:hypothetical protein
MDLKKKFADAKEKCKQNLPYIIAGIATVGTVALVVANHNLKKQNASSCDQPRDETHVYLDAEAIRRLTLGQTAEFQPIGDLIPILKNLVTED